MYVHTAHVNEVVMEDNEKALRFLHEAQGVCHRHPHVKISTGGGYPMFDGLCGACENEMDEAAELDEAAAHAAAELLCKELGHAYEPDGVDFIDSGGEGFTCRRCGNSFTAWH